MADFEIIFPASWMNIQTSPRFLGQEINVTMYERYLLSLMTEEEYEKWLILIQQ